MSQRAGDAAGSWLSMRLVVLWILELGLLVWYLWVPLPNAGSVAPKGIVLRRALFILESVPGLAVGRRSVLGRAFGEFAHPENLSDRLPIVGAAVLIAAAAIAVGSWILDALKQSRGLNSVERVAGSFALGMSALAVATLMIGRLGLLNPTRVRVGLGLLVCLGAVSFFMKKSRHGGSKPNSAETPTRGEFGWSPAMTFSLVAVCTPFVLGMILAAMVPTIEYDALSYHLQGPKEYFLNQKISYLPHNVYTNMPFQVEMGHLLGMWVLDDWWTGALAGQLLIVICAPATAALVASTVFSWGSARGAWVAGVVYLTTPWVYRMGVYPFVEGPLCLYHAALIWSASRALRAEGKEIFGGFLVVGLLAGGAMACKYPGLISAVVPFGALAIATAWRARSPWPALAFVVGVLAVLSPWLVKNAIDTGDPVYPLGYRVFGGADWDRALDARWSHAHGPRPIAAGPLALAVLDVAGRSDWQSSLFAALAPLAFFRTGSRRQAKYLWCYVGYLFATWWLLTHRLDRFWLPILPPLAMLAGMGSDWSRDRRWSILLGIVMVATIFINFVLSASELSGPHGWTRKLSDLRESVPSSFNPPLAKLDALLPRNAKVLSIGQVSIFHMKHAIIYNTVFNHETIETIARGRSPGEIWRALADLKITHIYVDWSEIERFRSEGNYGFSDFVGPELFARWVAAGVVSEPLAIGPAQKLFEVRGFDSARERSASASAGAGASEPGERQPGGK